MAYNVEKKGVWSIYHSTGSGIPLAADEMQFNMSFRTQPTGIAPSEYWYDVWGYLTDEFSYSSNANYENVWNPQDILPTPLANLIKDETQRSFATYGYATKKTFTNNTSQSITLKWRTVSHSNLKHGGVVNADNGETMYTNPVMIAKSLMMATMPTVGKNAFWNFTSVSEQLGQVVKEAITVGAGMLNAIANPLDTASNTIDAMAAGGRVMASVTGAAKTAANNLFPKHPPICQLMIGSMFKKDFMVVKNVEVTFSKEFFEPGVPLYGDYTVTLESLFNSSNQTDPSDEVKFGTGLISSTKSRVIDLGANKPKQSSIAVAGTPPSANQSMANMLMPNMIPTPMPQASQAAPMPNISMPLPKLPSASPTTSAPAMNPGFSTRMGWNK